MPAICANVLLGYLLDLKTLDFMLLIMVYIIYAFVGGAVVFEEEGNSWAFSEVIDQNSAV